MTALQTARTCPTRSAVVRKCSVTCQPGRFRMPHSCRSPPLPLATPARAPTVPCSTTVSLPWPHGSGAIAPSCNGGGSSNEPAPCAVSRHVLFGELLSVSFKQRHQARQTWTCLTGQVLPTGWLSDHCAGLCEVVPSYKAPAREITVTAWSLAGRELLFWFPCLGFLEPRWAVNRNGCKVSRQDSALL